MIFKLTVRGPLHADQLRGENGEARVADGDDGFGIGGRVSEVRVWLTVLCGRRWRWRSGLRGLSRGLSDGSDAESDCERKCGKVFQGNTHTSLLFLLKKEG
jgi:hypothetical protein